MGPIFFFTISSNCVTCCPSSSLLCKLTNSCIILMTQSAWVNEMLIKESFEGIVVGLGWLLQVRIWEGLHSYQTFTYWATVIFKVWSNGLVATLSIILKPAIIPWDKVLILCLYHSLILSFIMTLEIDQRRMNHSQEWSFLHCFEHTIIIWGWYLFQLQCTCTSRVLGGHNSGSFLS